VFPFIEEHKARILTAIELLEVGAHFRFHELFEERIWMGFGDGVARRGFGTQFAKAVKAEWFPMVERDGLFGDREVRYRKL